jgi:hypothetical protein
VAALLFVGFLTYLYAPHLIFKFAAAGKYDFVTRKELPQVEEFFAAALPSSFLNGLAWSVTRLLPWTRGIRIDRQIIGFAFAKDPDLSDYFSKGDVRSFVAYIAVLFFSSYVAGSVYGSSLRAIARAGGPRSYLDSATWWLLPSRSFAILYRRLWRPFYAQYEQPLYPQILQNAFAFVHTNTGLYHGILYAADKSPDGEIEGITLLRVSRFSRKNELESFAAGENPIRTLTGPLFIKWSEILDINYPPSGDVLERKKQEYEARMTRYAARNRSLLKRLIAWFWG